MCLWIRAKQSIAKGDNGPKKHHIYGRGKGNTQEMYAIHIYPDLLSVMAGVSFRFIAGFGSLCWLLVFFILCFTGMRKC